MGGRVKHNFYYYCDLSKMSTILKKMEQQIHYYKPCEEYHLYGFIGFTEQLDKHYINLGCENCEYLSKFVISSI